MALEDDIKKMRDRISAVQAKKARAAVELDNAKERLDAARAILKDDFGVETTTEARAKLDELRAQLATEMETIEELLTKAGA